MSKFQEGPITLKYGVFASDPDWNQENYGVYVSTTSDPTNESDFKLLFTEFDLPGVETERTVDLSEYAGQKIYVTFRHYDTTDMYRINIDNVSVVSGVSDGGGNENGDHLFYDGFENYDDFTIGGITETNNKGKIGDWTVVDVDRSYTYGFQGVSFPNTGVAKSFIVFNTNSTTPALTPTATSDWSARTGDKSMTAFAGETKNNDWLISPSITLGSSDNVLSFYAKAADINYGHEEFKVLVSTTDTELSSFTEIASEAIDGSNKFAEYKYDLSAYNGKKVFLAIQCVSNDQFGFVVDDFTVDGNTELSTSDINTKDITKVYPNPVQDFFTIDFGTNIDKSKVTLELYSFTGVKVKTFKSASTYDISSLPKGIYVLNINDGKTKIVKKIII